MSKKFLKITALAIACLMIVQAFAGCGGAKNADEKSTAGTPDAGVSAPANQEPVTIDWLGYYTYAQPDPDSEIIKQVEQWFNVKFNFWFVDDQQWDQVLGVKLAGGEMPDVMRIKDTAQVPRYVKMGVLAPITDDMMKKIPAVAKGIEEMGGSDMTLDGVVDGKQYVIKNPMVANSYPTVLVWRTDWLKNVGIDKMPENLTEWEEAMDKFTNGDPDQNGKKDTYGMSNTTMNAVFGAFGAIPLKEFRGKGTQNLFWTKKDGEYTFAAIQPEMKDALALLQKWYKAGYIDPEFVTGENTGGYWAESQPFENSKLGVTGMAMSYHWKPPLFEGAAGGTCYTAFLKVNPDAESGETFDIGKPPVGPDGKSGTHCWGAIGTTGGAFTTKLVKDSKKLDAVLNMINGLTSDYDKYLYSRYGVEGKHYTIDAKSGSISAIEPYNQAAEQVKAGLTVTSALFSIPDFDKKSPQYQFMDKYKSEGYTDLFVPATDAATKYTEDLKKLALDSYIKIITGEKPVDYFDEFVKTFNEKGGAEIMKQVNDAVNAR